MICSSSAVIMLSCHLTCMIPSNSRLTFMTSWEISTWVLIWPCFHRIMMWNPIYLGSVLDHLWCLFSIYVPHPISVFQIKLQQQFYDRFSCAFHSGSSTFDSRQPLHQTRKLVIQHREAFRELPLSWDSWTAERITGSFIAMRED